MSNQPYILRREDIKVREDIKENEAYLTQFYNDLLQQKFLMDKQGEYIHGLPKKLIIDDLEERPRIQALNLIAILREKSNLPFHLKSDQFEK